MQNYVKWVTSRGLSGKKKRTPGVSRKPVLSGAFASYAKSYISPRTFYNFENFTQLRSFAISPLTDVRVSASKYFALPRRSARNRSRRGARIYLRRCCFARGVTAKSPRNVICVTRFSHERSSWRNRLRRKENVLGKHRRRPPQGRYTIAIVIRLPAYPPEINVKYRHARHGGRTNKTRARADWRCRRSRSLHFDLSKLHSSKLQRDTRDRSRTNLEV